MRISDWSSDVCSSDLSCATSAVMLPAAAASSAAVCAAAAASAASAAESSACCWLLHAARAKPMARASSALLIVMSIFLVVKRWSATRGSAPANIMTIPLPLSSVVMSFFVKNPLKHSRHLDGDCGCLAADDAQGSHPELAAAAVTG